jgi:hypothetical protein
MVVTARYWSLVPILSGEHCGGSRRSTPLRSAHSYHYNEANAETIADTTHQKPSDTSSITISAIRQVTG